MEYGTQHIVNATELKSSDSRSIMALSEELSKVIDEVHRSIDHLTSVLGPVLLPEEDIPEPNTVPAPSQPSSTLSIELETTNRRLGRIIYNIDTLAKRVQL